MVNLLETRCDFLLFLFVSMCILSFCCTSSFADATRMQYLFLLFRFPDQSLSYDQPIRSTTSVNHLPIFTLWLHFRASHTFAIYFLLEKRLKRFQEAKRDSRNCQDFSLSKIKFVKKAKLSSDRISSTRSKFTYKGVKIRTNSTSHPRLHDDNTGFLILEKTYVSFLLLYSNRHQLALSYDLRRILGWYFPDSFALGSKFA